jgi:hypothetical protein
LGDERVPPGEGLHGLKDGGSSLPARLVRICWTIFIVRLWRLIICKVLKRKVTFSGGGLKVGGGVWILWVFMRLAWVDVKGSVHCFALYLVTTYSAWRARSKG